MKKIFLGFFFTLLFIYSSPVNAVGTKEIGDVCTGDSQCKSNDCESSSKKDNSGNVLKFCDCDEVSLTAVGIDNSSEDCKQKYGAPTDGSKYWICKNGPSETFGLDYCLSENGKTSKFPLSELQNDSSLLGKLKTSVLDSKVAQTQLLNEIKTFKPNDMIKIPNLTFTDVENTIDSEGYIHIPWIGELIKAIYNWGMVVASIVATIMIILTATKIIMGGGGATAEGYKKIGTIVVGLVIAWGSYAILYNINPALVEFKPLKVFYVQPISLREAVGDTDSMDPSSGGPIEAGSPDGTPSSQAKSMAGLLNPQEKATLDSKGSCNPAAAQYLAETLMAKQVCAQPCSCAWTASRFLSLIKCGNPINPLAMDVAIATEQKGWIAKETEPYFTQGNQSQLPVGLFWFPGHVGVSLGGGKMFDSAGGKPLVPIQLEPKCSMNAYDNVGTDNCKSCAHVAERDPKVWKVTDAGQRKDETRIINEKGKTVFRSIITKGKNAGKTVDRPPGCIGTHAWAIRSYAPSFNLIFYPPGNNSSQPEKGCCKALRKKVNTGQITSALLCKWIGLNTEKGDYEKMKHGTIGKADSSGVTDFNFNNGKVLSSWNPQIKDQASCNSSTF